MSDESRETNLQATMKDILDACQKVQRYTANRTFDEFQENEMVVDAVMWNLGVLGEAVNQLPDTFKERHSHIYWRGPIDLRNRLIHGYFEIDLKEVWNVIENDLPSLCQEIRGLTTTD